MEYFGKYMVAGHVFAIRLPGNYSKEDCLKPYEPFVYNGPEEPLFTVSIEVVGHLSEVDFGKVKECYNEEAPYFWILDNGRWNFGFSYSRKHPDCVVVPSEDFKDNKVYIPSGARSQFIEFAVSNATMLLYTITTTPRDTLLIHSSVTVKDGAAYAFLGKSGTGKSTHSRLWLENIEGTLLLNDDNPVVRVIDSKTYIYGSPWSGKTPCYKNDVKPLKGVVRLTQAPYNKIQKLPPVQAYAAFMPSCSCMKWDRNHTDALHKTVEAVVKSVNFWGLECLPDADAAFVCCNAVTA